GGLDLLLDDDRLDALFLNGHLRLPRLPPSNGRSYVSTNAYLAFSWMKSRRASTSSPIRIENIRSADAASSSVTCLKTRVSGFIVVSQSCSGFISPRPLKRPASNFLAPFPLAFWNSSSAWSSRRCTYLPPCFTL